MDSSDEDTELALMAASAGIIVAVLDARNKNVIRRRRRRIWAKEWLKRRDEGKGLLSMLKNELMNNDPLPLTNFVRMNSALFNKLLDHIEPAISKQDTVMRQCVPAEMRLAVTLRFLATGETFRSLMYSTRIHESTLSIFIPEVLQAIYDSLKEEYMKVPQSVREWKDVSQQFESNWQLPNCVGAMDGKHIAFRAPHSAGSSFYNYKGYHGIILLALVDAEYKFIYIYIYVGANGRVNDSRVFAKSSLAKALHTNSLNLPQTNHFLEEKCRFLML